MANRPKRTAKKDAVFFEALCDGKSVAEACALAGYKRRTVYDWRKACSDFDADFEDALKMGTEALEDEARRRAFDGYDEPIFYDGKIVGQRRKYSDTLLMFVLKARDPERYRDRQDVTTSGTLIVETSTFGDAGDDGE